ncbi:hypothetical protein MSTO_11700 [Mycobacterium stomatepiae]|uniref:Uncharacterized protein n=1 Tax=Mycobacterium stomatepiae TaxID=470076 RepID=A0A7I7Q3N5_9MYCO|nr:hypothetical protein MSTO_11700 [Mycobacterium stomatepiae]
MQNVAIGFEERDAAGLGLGDHLPDRLLQQIAMDGTFDQHQKAKLPLGTRETGFLREPNIKLPARQRMCPLTTFHVSPPKVHPSPRTQAVYLSKLRPAASRSRRLFGRISGQFCSM